jgi:DNA-binding response OmpR family regulator
VLLISGEDQVRSGGGADRFLAKPFNARQLLAALDGLLPPAARSPGEK